jgi:hypothetical protein
MPPKQHTKKKFSPLFSNKAAGSTSTPPKPSTGKPVQASVEGFPIGSDTKLIREKGNLMLVSVFQEGLKQIFLRIKDEEGQKDCLVFNSAVETVQLSPDGFLSVQETEGSTFIEINDDSEKGPINLAPGEYEAFPSFDRIEVQLVKINGEAFLVSHSNFVLDRSKFVKTSFLELFKEVSGTVPSDWFGDADTYGYSFRLSIVHPELFISSQVMAKGFIILSGVDHHFAGPHDGVFPVPILETLPSLAQIEETNFVAHESAFKLTPRQAVEFIKNGLGSGKPESIVLLKNTSQKLPIIHIRPDEEVRRACLRKGFDFKTGGLPEVSQTVSILASLSANVKFAQEASMSETMNRGYKWLYPLLEETDLSKISTPVVVQLIDEDYPPCILPAQRMIDNANLNTIAGASPGFAQEETIRAYQKMILTDKQFLDWLAEQALGDESNGKKAADKYEFRAFEGLIKGIHTSVKKKIQTALNNKNKNKNKDAKISDEEKLVIARQVAKDIQNKHYTHPELFNMKRLLTHDGVIGK